MLCILLDSRSDFNNNVPVLFLLEIATNDMDWTLALKLNQDVLLRNVTWLFTWLKLDVGETVEILPRHQWRTVLFVLRPSESACRRLVLIASFVLGTVAAPVVDCARPARRTERSQPTEGQTRKMPPSFRLIDPRKNFDLFPNRPKFVRGPGPRITDLWSDDPIYDRSDLYAWQARMNAAPSEDISAVGLCRRMNALIAALEDLPGQAQRMVNLRARMARLRERTGKPDLHPLRPGLPPGFRQRQKHEVDAVLTECHQLALTAQHELGTQEIGPQELGPPKPG